VFLLSNFVGLISGRATPLARDNDARMLASWLSAAANLLDIVSWVLTALLVRQVWRWQMARS